eukprot:5219162-Alexandrium_andersonii.AAC.1
MHSQTRKRTDQHDKAHQTPCTRMVRMQDSHAAASAVARMSSAHATDVTASPNELPRALAHTDTESAGARILTAACRPSVSHARQRER